MLSKQYIAGVLDGESYIGVSGGRLQIQVETTCKKLIDKLYLQLGGYRSTRHREGNCQRSYRWGIEGLPALSVLADVGPYLVTKEPHRLLAETYLSLRDLGCARRSPEMEALGKEMRKLNRVGRFL